MILVFEHRPIPNSVLKESRLAREQFVHHYGRRLQWNYGHRHGSRTAVVTEKWGGLLPLPGN